VGSGSEALCRFDELGRFQFERLCRDLLALDSGVGGLEWFESATAAVLVLPEGADVPWADRPHAESTLVVAAWVQPAPADTQLDRLRRAVARVVEDWPGARPRSVLALTNIEASDAVEVGLEVVDATRLTRLVLSRPRLRLRLPSLLGICEESALVADAARSRSTADVAAAFALSRVFVPTRAYASTVGVLERFGFAVLTGPPEMGKTAIARMVGLAKLSENWEFHECIRPDQLWERLSRDRAQVFVADDAFGSTEYRSDAAERWAVELDRVLRAMDERHWLIWTSRPAPLKAGLRRIQREHGVERFPQPAEVQVDAADLEVEEKALILFRHAKAARLPQVAVDVIRSCGWSVVSHQHFTPERIRRFVAGPLLQPDALARLQAGELEQLISSEIREPTVAMAESFRALAPEHRSVLIALLDVPPGPVLERDLATAVRRHSALAFAQHPGALLDRLTDHFVRVVEGGAVTWVHPSWRDLVIDELGRDPVARRSFLCACSLEGILLALSIGGGSAGTRALPLLHEDGDWDAAADRLRLLVPQLDEPSATRLLVVLGEALALSTDARARELDALAGCALQLLARHWSEQRELIPAGLLDRWLELGAAVSEQPPLPDVTTTWIERMPSVSAAGPVSAAELAELDEWLSLAELLSEYAPGRLRAFGFPDGQHESVSAFVHRLHAGAAEIRDRGAVLGALHRVAILMPANANDAYAAAATIAARGPEAPPAETYVPREISQELLNILDAPPIPVRSDEHLVTRVLRDL